MPTDTQYTVTQRTPEIEAYELGLLAAAKNLTDAGLSTQAPAYQVAGLTPMETQAAQMAQAGIGSYVPYLQGGLNRVIGGSELLANAAVPTLAQGQEYAKEAGRLAQQTREFPYRWQTAAGEGMLASAGSYDPSMNVNQFLNPYTENVVDITQADIAERGELARNQQNAQAVGAGAFGGARQGIMDATLSRDILREQGRAGAELRERGYWNAQQAGQKAFEDTQQRRLAASQGLGRLGLDYGALSQQDVAQMRGIGSDLSGIAAGYGALGQQQAGFGIQQAGLGELAQRQLGTDIQTGLGIGGLQRGIQQAELEALRQSNVAAQASPYQALSWYGDIIRGVPSGSQTKTTTASRDPSNLQQMLGLGAAGLGAYQASQPYRGLMP